MSNTISARTFRHHIFGGGAPLKSNVIHVPFGRTRIDGNASPVVERREVYDWEEAWDRAIDGALDRLEARREPKPYDWDAAWDRRFQEGLDELLREQAKKPKP